MSRIAALTARLRKPGREVQLFPSGLFRARDGRPAGIDGWRMNADAAHKLVAMAAQRQTPFVIDYEHQTLYAETSGNPAPAAAWFERLEWREGDGLYAVDVEWTARAAAMIQGDEYRFLSPVFKFDKTGSVTELLMVAVTNNPAIDGIADVAAARYLQKPQEETKPAYKELLRMLGLAEFSTTEQVRAAVQALINNAASARANLAVLSTQLRTDEVDALVSAGLNDGRLTSAMGGWARALGRRDVAALRGYLQNAKSIDFLISQPIIRETASADQTRLSEEELAVCRAMDYTTEEFLKAKGVKV